MVAMGDSLRLTQFRPASSKVKCIEFHPMQPWLAIANKANKVSVWNFVSEQVSSPPSIRPFFCSISNTHQITCTAHDSKANARPCFDQVVYETSLGTPDDEAQQDANLQRAAEREPDYFGAHLSEVRHRSSSIDLLGPKIVS